MRRWQPLTVLETLVSERTVCPNCGCPVAIPEPAKDASHTAVIRSMEHEIRKLQETVAMLRGTRAG
jgi:hypothetical protein